jgi:hypothetical protein
VTRRSIGVVLVALGCVALGACGGDDAVDPGDEASFCRLATEADPVAEAGLETLTRLAEVAPVEIRDQVGVLVDLAAQLDDAGLATSEALAIEFDVRFSDEYVAARRDVEAYQRTECRAEVAKVTTTSTTEAGEPDASTTSTRPSTTSTRPSTTSTTPAGDDAEERTGGDNG